MPTGTPPSPDHPNAEALTRIKEIYLDLMRLRYRTIELLNADEMSSLRETLGIIVGTLTLEEEEESDLLAMIRHIDFTLGLKNFKANIDLKDSDTVLYVGSSIDTSVQRVFPQALNIDIVTPDSLPEGYHFLEADALNLPQNNDSTDLIVVRNLLLSVVNLPGFAQEMARVIKSGGHLFIKVASDPRSFKAIKTVGGENDQEIFTGREAYDSFIVPALNTVNHNMEEAGFNRISELDCTMIFKLK